MGESAAVLGGAVLGMVSQTQFCLVLDLEGAFFVSEGMRQVYWHSHFIHEMINLPLRRLLGSGFRWPIGLEALKNSSPVK